MTHRPSVLIVEDERQLADLYAEWLADEYDVRTAYDADQALSAIDDGIEVMLLDRRLPRSSGDEVLEEIHRRGIDCQVAMVTAVDPDFDILELGFDDYVIKPIERGDLRDLVQRLLTRGLYNDEVREYFSLVSKRANLETSKSPAELAEDQRYQELVEEIEALEDRLDDIIGQLEDKDFAAVLKTLKRGDPSMRTETGSS